MDAVDILVIGPPISTNIVKLVNWPRDIKLLGDI